MPISSSKIQTLTNSVKDTYVYPRTLSSAVIFENGNSYGGSANETLNTTLSRAVFLNTTQTITGAKTFSLDTTFEGHLLPGTTNSKNLGSSSKRWSKLYLGTQDTYGSSTQPIYWNNGVPALTELNYMEPVKVTITDNLVYGYYYNNNFYQDFEGTIPISNPSSDKIYYPIQNDGHTCYLYNNGTYVLTAYDDSIIVYTADKTINQIATALTNNNFVYCYYRGQCYYLTGNSADPNNYLVFAAIIFAGVPCSMVEHFTYRNGTWSYSKLAFPVLEEHNWGSLYDKGLLFTNQIQVSLVDGDTLYLTSNHRNTCLLLQSFGNTVGTEFQTSSDFNIDDEFEIVSGKMTTVQIREDDTNGIFIYNNGHHGDWQLTPGYGVASLKLMSIEPSSAGSSYDYDYEWMIKGDVSLI